jgi:DNA-directed RNA polymerase subunit RPC12/RpoP
MNDCIQVDSTMAPVAYAWPGGYPVFYLTEQNNLICAKCAKKSDFESDLVASSGINYEDTDMACNDCGSKIDAAYAE